MNPHNWQGNYVNQAPNQQVNFNNRQQQPPQNYVNYIPYNNQVHVNQNNPYPQQNYIQQNQPQRINRPMYSSTI
jgi:hypothetical protein